jgi:hypothetical protein
MKKRIEKPNFLSDTTIAEIKGLSKRTVQAIRYGQRRDLHDVHGTIKRFERFFQAEKERYQSQPPTK